MCQRKWKQQESSPVLSKVPTPPPRIPEGPFAASTGETATERQQAAPGS